MLVLAGTWGRARPQALGLLGEGPRHGSWHTCHAHLVFAVGLVIKPVLQSRKLRHRCVK